jgi:sialic acid synthase SpsE
MKSSTLSINGRELGPAHRPYLIAEMSANHNGRLETALAILEAAKSAGADALKLQTYTPDTITLDCNHEEFLIKGGLWEGRTTCTKKRTCLGNGTSRCSSAGTNWA